MLNIGRRPVGDDYADADPVGQEDAAAELRREPDDDREDGERSSDADVEAAERSSEVQSKKQSGLGKTPDTFLRSSW